MISFLTHNILNVNRYLISLYILLLACTCRLSAQPVLRGRVLSDADNTPLAGATVKVKGSPTGVSADQQGSFVLPVPAAKVLIVVSFLGFETIEREVDASGGPLVLHLKESRNQLAEVVVSSGYQQLNRERATGSFVQLDSALLNRRVSTDVLSRLRDVVPGLVFNSVGSNRENQTNILVRGQSTITSRTDPLIVIDNFPYEGDLRNINPNDVESISILKDAAAASIWGARSANGVIVITTKKGKVHQAPLVSFNASLTVGDKPDLFYYPQIASADFIEMEKTLFARGFYTSAETSADKTSLTLVAELLIAKRDGKMEPAQADARIEALKQYDVRHDFTQYFYRKSVDQQYALSVSGGGQDQRYYLSAGFDRNLQSLMGNDYSRVSLNATNTYSFAHQRLELTTGVYYTGNKAGLNYQEPSAVYRSSSGLLYPYARLADEDGNALPVAVDYRPSFIEEAGRQGLLDWEYKPLEEIGFADNTSKETAYRLNSALKFKAFPFLSATVLYQYGREVTDRRYLRSQQTYYTRNQINRLTVVNANGSLTYPVPLGGILDAGRETAQSHNLRAQLNLDKRWGRDHELTAIAGWEVSERTTTGNSSRYYGYDDVHGASKPVNYDLAYVSYVNPASRNNRIADGSSFTDLNDRYLSSYGNAAYTYRQRYTLSASARLDQSNLFGVETNQKGVPLWSAGLSWNVVREDFYHWQWLPVLRLRATYGYNGAVDKSLSAYTTAVYISGTNNWTGLPSAMIQNPPNPGLRWERVKVLNLGLDFALKKDVLSGSVEYYRKKGIDIIGSTPYAPQTGITSFKGNTAGTLGRGVDLSLNSRNIDRAFKWYSSLLFSVAKDQVQKYLDRSADVNRYLSSSFTVPLEGKPLYAVYSYRWAGLDPQTGDPQGYLDGEVSKDYTAIFAAARPENLLYHGPLRPVTYGAFRNTFSYRGLSVSANISYRLGYFFRRESINYSTFLAGNGGHGDYYRRWQKPGDENRTDVPSVPEVTNANRNTFYTYSEVLVEKGDHIRLEDIQAGYDLDRRRQRWLPFRNAQLYLYMTNLGLLWKAAKGDIDPDYTSRWSFPAARTVAFGFKASL